MNKVYLLKSSIKSKNFMSLRTTLTLHPETGEQAPKLEDFDPLNPGNWQLGVSLLLLMFVFK